MEKAVLEQRRLNGEKAAYATAQLFPGEKWILVENGIYLSPHRAIGQKSNYKDELRDAQILRDLGSTVYLVSEPNTEGKKYDAIVDGEKMEFKNVTGGHGALEKRFIESRWQAPNVFINLEESNLSSGKIMATLYGARNSPKYPENNGISGGKIVLRIKGINSLIYLNVDDLKQKKPNV